MEDAELKQTVLKMLQAELEAMNFYQQASCYIKDHGALYHFNLLAEEELEHARLFYTLYPDNDLADFDELIKVLPNQKATLSTIDPQLLGRLNERAALQLAIKMEEEVAQSLRLMLQKVSSPAAKAAIEENLDSTLGHLELVQEDYRRIFASPTSE